MADIKMIKYHSLPMPQARALVQQAADNLAAGIRPRESDGRATLCTSAAAASRAR